MGQFTEKSHDSIIKVACLDLTEDPVARGVHGRHAGGHICHGLVFPILEADVSIGGLYLPPAGQVLDGPKRVVHEVAVGGRGKLEVGILDPVEGLRKEQHLPVHMGIIPVCSEELVPHQWLTRRRASTNRLWGRWETSEELLDGAAEGEGDEVDTLGLLGGGAEGFGGEDLLRGLGEQRRSHLDHWWPLRVSWKDRGRVLRYYKRVSGLSAMG